MKKHASLYGLVKVTVTALLTLNCFAGNAQDAPPKVVQLPQSKKDITSNVLVSEVVFNSMISGKIPCYKDKDCKQLMSPKTVKAAFTDSVTVQMTGKTGEIIGHRKMAKLFTPDSLTEFWYFIDKKPSIILGYRQPIFTQGRDLLGYRSVCYIKFADIDKVLAPFEKKYYNTRFREQLN